MNSLIHNKVVLYGGAGVLALVAGWWIYSSLGSSSTASATGSDVPSQLADTPISYSSGTGTVPIDSSSIAGAGQSSIDYLSAITQLQGQQESDANAYQTASLAVEQSLGQSNIDASLSLGLANTSANTTSALGTLAAAIQQAVTNKGGLGASGVVSGGGQSINYTVENLTGSWNHDKTLVNGSSGISLIGGGTIAVPKAA